MQGKSVFGHHTSCDVDDNKDSHVETVHAVDEDWTIASLLVNGDWLCFLETQDSGPAEARLEKR